jgi:phenylpropionate dioxygenase-like ring-hydroxylating dioxygenase large terminal subunit
MAEGATELPDLVPEDYLDPAVLEIERERILFCQWHIVGLSRDLPNTDDWRVIKIAGTELILQNVGDGEFRAFTNVCPHRFNAIRQSPMGNGALRCSYHFWSFDRDGAVKKVSRHDDDTHVMCQTHTRLEQWSLELCGEWIFVSRKPLQSLKEFLGSYYLELGTLSRGLGKEIESFEQEVAANWKLLLENTMEFDHINAVHPETFAPLWPKPASSVEVETHLPHMSYLAKFTPPDLTKSSIRRIEKIFERAVLEPISGHAYWLVSPSATIGRTFNRQIALVTYQPISPDRTLLKARLFIPRLDNVSAADSAILDKVLPLDIAFTHKLLSEDTRICISVQRGLANAPKAMRGCLMPGDKFIRLWRQWWLKAMGRL